MITDAKLIEPNPGTINPINRADKMTEEMAHIAKLQRERVEFDQGFANVIYESLMREIHDFELTLMPDEEIGTYVTSFGQQILIGITTVRYVKPYLIIFDGFNENTSAKVRLVQHISQTSVLFEVMKVPQGREARRFGFLPNKD